VPEITYVYYARSALWESVRWIWDGGMTPFFISQIVGKRVWFLRNLTPLELVSFLVNAGAGVLAGAWSSLPLLVLSVLGALASIDDCLQAGEPTLVSHLFAVYMLTHLIYRFGSWAGILHPQPKGDWVRS